LQASLDIRLVRIDNRLVHGQILEAWIPFLHVSCIVVVDDQAASDFFRETVIRMAVPRHVDVIIQSVKDFVETTPFQQGSGHKTIVLFSAVGPAREAFEAGFRFNKLNIGNIYNDSYSICCTPSVLLSEKDVTDITFLRDSGVKVELRRVPREKPLDFFDAVRSIKT
jgi:mannose/fructose/N-acetylgalactosamine-specific phosphotransferase system component IIB